MVSRRLPSRVFLLIFACFSLGYFAHTLTLKAAELPLVRIAHGAFSEKVVALWLGVEQGLYRKHGVNVEVINIRSGPQTMAALVSGDIQVAYTIPGSVVSAATSGLDVAFFAGIVNKADGDFIAGPSIHNAEDLRGKRIGVQSIGGGGLVDGDARHRALGFRTEPRQDDGHDRRRLAGARPVVGIGRYRSDLS